MKQKIKIIGSALLALIIIGVVLLWPPPLTVRASTDTLSLDIQINNPPTFDSSLVKDDSGIPISRHYYLSTWTGTGVPHVSPFIPLVSTYDTSADYSCIDLRDDCTKVNGYCIVAIDSDNIKIPVRDTTTILLAASTSTTDLTLSLKMANALGLNASDKSVSGSSLTEVIYNYLSSKQTFKPEKDGEYRIFLGSQLYGTPQPALGHTTIYDSFNRTNGALGTSSDGTWSWSLLTGSLVVYSNQAYSGSTAQVSLALANSSLGATNMYSQITTQSGGDYGVCTRFPGGSTQTCYCFEIYTGGSEIDISKFVSGTQTAIDNKSATYGSGYILKAESNGSTQTVWYNGSQIDSLTDTSISTGNYAGLFSYDAYSYMDNFESSSLGGGTPSLTVSPTSFDFGSLWQSKTYYAKGAAPNNPVVDGDCTFTITNDGSITENITASMTNMTGGTSWNGTSGTPGLNTFRMTIYYSGENPSSGLVLSTSAQVFYNGLTASGTKKFDIKYETGTWADGDTAQRSGTLQLTAIAP